MSIDLCETLIHNQNDTHKIIFDRMIYLAMPNICKDLSNSLAEFGERDEC